ncbi:MAG: hypothetical protein M5U08_24850 [Burkholderiales bacterium]|nr:hypothetical protein [Burkholderiales bacterium]
MDPGLFGCIAALVWVLHRHASLAAISVAPRRGLGSTHQRVLGATRMGVAMLGGAVFVVAVAALAGAARPGLDGPILYLSGVCLALAVLVGLEAAVFDFRRRHARAAAREAAQRKRPRSVRTMMRLGLGPRSEPLR